MWLSHAVIQQPQVRLLRPEPALRPQGNIPLLSLSSRLVLRRHCYYFFLLFFFLPVSKNRTRGQTHRSDWHCEYDYSPFYARANAIFGYSDTKEDWLELTNTLASNEPVPQVSERV